MIMILSVYFDWIYDKNVLLKMSCINFMHIKYAVLEKLRMFYFQNISDISNSRDEIYIIYISIDWKFDFKFSQINVLEIQLKRLRKNLKITI